MRFFSKLPKIYYGESPSVNIMSRVSTHKLSLENKQTYFDYVIPEGDSLDNLAYDYYKNSDYYWLIALCNNIIDPYYDIPLSQNDFDSYIIKKYGTIDIANQTIAYWQNNWYGDESNLTSSGYNALPENLKKYWTLESVGTGYQRKQQDLQTSTNKIILLTLSTDTSNFLAGERILQDDELVATINTAGNGVLLVEHISGTISTGSITGETSGATGTVTDSALMAQNIPDDELVYWSPVSAYEMEETLNNQKKNIRLLDSRFAGQASKELRDLYVSG